MPRPSLSISSSIITHCRLPARRMPCRMLPGKRADIGAAMAADLGLVMRAAEADPDEFAPGRARDALAERGLADPGRPDKAQDRAAPVRVQLVDREEFEDAPLDLLQAVMVLVEDRGAPRRCRSAPRPRPPRAVRSAIRDRCAPSNIRRPASGMRSSRASSFLACASTSSRHLRLVDLVGAARRFPGLLASSPSPSSFWIVFSCSRSRNSRCRSSIVSLVRSLIWRDRRSTSSRYASSSETRSSRRSMSKVSRISCFSAGVMSIKLAIRSASAGAEVTPCTALTSSAGVCGSSCSTSSAWLRRLQQPRVDLRVLLLRLRQPARRARRKTDSRRGIR